MKLIFSKDECAPDAPTLNMYKYHNGIELDHTVASIEVEYYDQATKYYVARNGDYYKEVHACGVYEDLYRFNDFEEYKDDLKNCLLNKCNFGFLKEESHL